MPASSFVPRSSDVLLGSLPPAPRARAADDAWRDLVALPAAALAPRRPPFLPGGWVDRSAFFVAGAEHAAARRAISGALGRARIEAHAPALRAIAREVLAEEIGRGRPFEVHRAMLEIAARSIGVFVLGSQAERALRQVVRGALAPLDAPLAYAPPFRLELFGWTPWGRFVRAKRALREVLRARVERARVGGGDEGAGIEALAGAARGLHDDAVVDQAITMLATGREPVAAALAWAVVAIDEDDLAARDARRALAALGAEPRASALRACAPLEALVDRALARGPVVPEIVRRLAREATIGGRRVAAGAEVRARVAAGGERGCPVRAFGGGAHGCLGRELARATLSVVLGVWLGEHELVVVARDARGRRRNAVRVPARLRAEGRERG